MSIQGQQDNLESTGQRPDGYTSFMEGLYEGLMDDKGNVVISPKRGYRSIGDFIDGVAIGFRLNHKPKEGGWGLLNEKGEKITEFKYWFIELFCRTQPLLCQRYSWFTQKPDVG